MVRASDIRETDPEDTLLFLLRDVQDTARPLRVVTIKVQSWGVGGGSPWPRRRSPNSAVKTACAASTSRKGVAPNSAERSNPPGPPEQRDRRERSQKVDAARLDVAVDELARARNDDLAQSLMPLLVLSLTVRSS